ncbi:cytochrome P450 reductase 2 [Pleomassaria siparia CBS 279.74]|uniref:Cytochrome P450 reductase 2 n=1 Tax=Pleomassaria siparia CBS 279.74 TaxID=1314801 RepID=A0A6G1JRH8_9PLEO|nr:cytochrome P450 reductase 2 [Pleomassaria siparia CBS 279.74]
MKPASTADGIAILLFLFSVLGYIYFERPQVQDGEALNKTTATRNIAQRLEEGRHKCVIFWGSQSGTSERFAETLARECASMEVSTVRDSFAFWHQCFGGGFVRLRCRDLGQVSKSKFAMFILSTYGEGDPSDNTAGLWDWIERVKNDKLTLKELRYLAWGLGNSNYKYYNRIIDVVTDVLDAAGATPLIPKQKADDANSGTEEDFQSWKDDVFAMFRVMGFEERSFDYQLSIEVIFNAGPDDVKTVTQNISVHHQRSATCSEIVPLSIKSSRELFTTGDRNCIHLELDLSHRQVGYKTGDHIGIWPCNPEEEIDRLVDVLGLQSRRNHAFTIKMTCLHLAPFALTPEFKAFLLEISKSRNRYERLILSTHITLTLLPLSFVLESVPALQPRYYSISSSSVIAPRRIAITALVVNKTISGSLDTAIHGLTSNYILLAAKLPSNASVPTPSFQHTELVSLEGTKVFAHARKSKFKLPINSSTPLVLISAGTSFAPFRAFLVERAKLHAIGKSVGKTLFFFGCRSQDSDFIYKEEMKESLGQHLVAEHSANVLDMLDAGANMYICGRANMAREIDVKIEEAVKEAKGLKKVEPRAWTDALKKRGKWRADVWG